MAAVTHRRWFPVLLVASDAQALRTIVVDKSNVGPYELPVEKRICPAMDAAVAN